MKRICFNLVIALALSLAVAQTAPAQRKRQTVKPRAEIAPAVVSEAGETSPAAARTSSGEVVRASEIYKRSLRQLLAAREAEAARAGEQFEKLKGLYADGLISKRALEEAETSLLETRHKVEETRRGLEATDELVVETEADQSSAATYEAVAAAPPGSALKRVAYIRYKGTAGWSPANLGKVENFFFAKFKRRLPVSANGQSDLHTRLGYDHRNAVDVAVNPDTPEGQALMRYLSGEGIPFIAFRRSVPGSATGPHIHIGQPSEKSSGK